MELTRAQENGLRIAIERYRNKEPYTVISGYAGTGKSTLIKFIIAALEIDPGAVAYVAYTGKAAQVLRSRGCPNATTAHRLLYKSVQMPDGNFKHIPKTRLPNYKIVVVDEISMLPKPMWELLLSHGIYVIACGDPGQLPPIGESTGVLDHPHIFLNEIMRQAADSEIIRLSSSIRNGEPIKPFRGREINVVPRRDLVDGMFTWADQIICAKNTTRRSFNHYFRRMKWDNEDISSFPLVGDKVICLKNNWDKITEAGDALVNGTIGTIEDMYTSPNEYLGMRCAIGFLPDTYDSTDVRDQQFHDLLIDWKLITTGEPTINKNNFSTFPKKLRPEQFDYGYVITCWKAQGSEWDKVLFIAEKTAFMNVEMYRKFLYTGCTRAAKKLTLVY